MKRTVIAALLLAVGLSAQAQMIGATNNQQTPRTRTSDSTPLYQLTGSYLRFEGGFPIIASAAYCYQFTPWFMLGGGVGFGMSGGYYWSEIYYSDFNPEHYRDERPGSWCMPVFIEAELRTPRYKWSLFLNLKFGYNAFKRSDFSHTFYNNGLFTEYGDRYYPFLFTASTGVSYKNFSFGAGYSSALYSSAFKAHLNAYISYSLPLGKLF